MPKNIVICSDGTGNTTIRGRGTNVFKVFFMASWAVLLTGAIGVTVGALGAAPSFTQILKSLATLVGNVVTLQVTALWEMLKAMMATHWRVALVAAVLGFALAGYLARRADRGITTVFSGFWHQQQTALRAALKQVRKDAREARDSRA